MSGYDALLARREVEDSVADVFEAEFLVVTGRSVEIVGRGESPDYEVLIDDVKTGLELTAIHAGDAETILAEMRSLAGKKGASYRRRGLFIRPIILLGHLDWPAPDVEGAALFDWHNELADIAASAEFECCGFSEVWLMDAGYKYSSRRDPRRPADFFCFGPNNVGFHQRERKRVPYWSFAQDRFL